VHGYTLTKKKFQCRMFANPGIFIDTVEENGIGLTTKAGDDLIAVIVFVRPSTLKSVVLVLL